MRALALALAVVLLASPAAALEAAPERPPASRSTYGQLPLVAGSLSMFVPGLGHWVLGQRQEAALSLGLTALPLVAGLAGAPPVIFADLPDQRASLWLLTAQEVWSMQAYMAYMAARKQIGNAGYPQPYREPSPLNLVMAPFKLEHLFDGRVWATVGASLASNILLEIAAPDPPGAETPYLFDARYAEVAGQQTAPGVGYGLHLVGSTVLSTHAGVGEEVLFRGMIQDEAERYLGRVPGLVAASALFGLVHVGGINQTSHFKQFTATGIGGLWFGGLYIATDYDLEKAIAAHTYYDIVAFGLSGLYPTRQGNNVFGIRYQF